MEKEVREYLAEMDVPHQIIDQMFATGPDAIRKIGLSELEKTVNGPAASVQEWLHKRCDYQLKWRRKDQLLDTYQICLQHELTIERAKKFSDENDPILKSLQSKPPDQK